MCDEWRVFHCHLLCCVGVVYLLNVEIFPFFREGNFLGGAEDGVFCATEFRDGDGQVQGLSLSVFGDGDAEVTSGGGCPLVCCLVILSPVSLPESDDLF